MSHSTTIHDLDGDVTYLIIEDIWNTTRVIASEEGQVPVNRGSSLIALSVTCRQMREAALPWIFREVYNWPNSLWPRSLWRFFK